MGFLIDSTEVIRAEREGESPTALVERLLGEFGDVEMALSVMTAGELFHGCWRANTPERRARREEFVESLLSVIPTVPITLATMRIYGEIDAQLRASGQRLPASDLLIACTALLRGDDVVTGNPRHFARVPGLSVRVSE